MTFIGKDPWPAIPEGLLKIMWQLLSAGRKTTQATAPVARNIHAFDLFDPLLSVQAQGRERKRRVANVGN